MKLWLDDDRPAPEGWVWRKTALDAIRDLKSMKSALDSDLDHVVSYDYSSRPIRWKEWWTITHMSFNHDLADIHYKWFHATQALPEDHPVCAHAKTQAAKEMTGYDVLLWMAEHEVWPTEACYVHTHNSVRGPVMADMINRYGPYETRVRWTPYQPTAEEI